MKNEADNQPKRKGVDDDSQQKQKKQKVTFTKKSHVLDLIKHKSSIQLSDAIEEDWVNLLSSYNVTTVEQWCQLSESENGTEFQTKTTDLCKKNGGNMFTLNIAIWDAAKKEDRAEDVLLAMQFYVPQDVKQSCFVDGDDAIKRYQPLAVSVRCTDGAAQDRGDCTFSLVLGSSGSGKSLFALRGVAEKIYKTKSHFTCMTLADRVCPTDGNPKDLKDLGKRIEDLKKSAPTGTAGVAEADNMSTEDMDSNNKLETLENEYKDLKEKRIEEVKSNLKKTVREMIKDALTQGSVDKLPFDPNKDSLQDMDLCVVVDEAGIGGFTDLITVDTDINNIASALKDICNSYTLVLVGTGIADVTGKVDSQPPYSKFRMGEWTMSNFQQMVGLEVTKPKIVDIVAANPRLLKMVSNARCAYFVMKAVGRQLTFTPPKAVEAGLSSTALTSIVVEVAHQYMDNNGLKRVKARAFEAQCLVRAVLKVLQDDIDNFRCSKTSNGTRTLKFPDYEQYLPEESPLRAKLIKLCNGVVDVHVETKEGGVELMDQHHGGYAISISAGMALVLSVLLGGDNAIELDWSTFETTVAVGEMLEVLKQSELDVIRESPLRLVHSQKQFPGNKKNMLRVPRALKNTIVVNGPRADYGDVFSPKRLCQAKFSEGGLEAKLYLLEELHKLGVTSNNWYYEKQQIFTAHLCHKWDNGDDAAAANKKEKKKTKEEKEEEEVRNSNYVASLLVAKQEKDEALASDMISEDSAKEGVIDGLKLIFATNASTFRIPSLAELPTTLQGLRKRARVLGLLEDGTESQVERRVKQFLKNKNIYDGITINRRDVTADGRLIGGKQLPGYVDEWLSAEMDIRFMFY